MKSRTRKYLKKENLNIWRGDSGKRRKAAYHKPTLVPPEETESLRDVRKKVCKGEIKSHIEKGKPEREYAL